MPKCLFKAFMVLISALLLSACAIFGKPPSPNALIERHIAAAYGEEGLDAQPAMIVEGRLVMDEYDVDAPFVMKIEAPDKRYFQTTVAGVDIVRSCIEGKCWAREMDSPLERLSGQRLAFMAEIADFYRLQNLLRYYHKLETTELTEFGGKDAYELQLTRNNGAPDRWYFSKDSGLWLGGIWRLPRSMGGTQVTQYFDSYRPFDSVRLATEITETSPTNSRMLVEEVRFEDIPDSEFVVAE